MIHYKDSDACEYWCGYDEEGKLNKIHHKIDDYQKWYKFDEKENVIYSKDSRENEQWWEYDKNNNLIHYKDSNGNGEWKEYDERGNCIRVKTCKVYECQMKYDENNNMVYSKDSDGITTWNI